MERCEGYFRGVSTPSYTYKIEESLNTITFNLIFKKYYLFKLFVKEYHVSTRFNVKSGNDFYYQLSHTQIDWGEIFNKIIIGFVLSKQKYQFVITKKLLKLNL